MLEAEFDRFAQAYRDSHAASIRLSGEDPDFFAKAKVDDMAAALARDGASPRRILDFGAGVGNSLPFLRASFPKAEVTALDPSARSLELAERRFPGHARFQCFDGNTIPAPDGSFDLAFAACSTTSPPTSTCRYSGRSAAF